MKRDVKVGTANVGTLRGRSREIVDMLARRRIDICCLQETRYKNEGCTTIGSGDQKYKLWYVGNGDSTNGVGIMTKHELADCVIDVTRYSDRLISIKLVIEDKVWHVFSMYAPQVGRSTAEKQAFWESVEDEIGKVPSNDGLILAGDTNAHIGTDITGYEEVLGLYGFGDRNGEGEQVLTICKSHELRVLNTFFKKGKEKRITYKVAGAETQIDLIMMRKTSGTRVIDCTVMPGEECLTQHRLVRADLLIETLRKEKRTPAKRIKFWKLNAETKRKEFESEFENNMKEEDGSYAGLVKSLLSAGKTVCGETRGQRGPERETWWWNAPVQNSIREKKDAYKKWQRSGSHEDLVTYCLKKREAKRCVAESRKKAWEEWSANLSTPVGRNKMFRVAAQMRKDKKDISSTNYIRNEEGHLVVKSAEVREVWRRYFEKLSNEENPSNFEVEDSVEGPVEDITLEEVNTAIRSMKNGKAPGPTGVNSEMFKLAGIPAAKELRNVFQQIMNTNSCPSQWMSSLTIALYKGKGDPLNCNQHRGLRLLDHGMKIFEKVLNNKLRKLISIDDSQFAYMPGKSCSDALFIVRRLQEKYLEKKKALYHIFVDIQKAFDRVPRQAITWALRRQQVPERLIDVIMSLYAYSKSTVNIAGGTSKEFDINVGLHQGSSLSPILFVLVMEEATKACRSGRIWNLLYADDLVLTADTKEEVTEMFVKWRDAMARRGLKVNIEKTKVMVSGSKNNEQKPTGRYPCGVCKRGVGSNSILCSACSKWCHKRCSGLRSLNNVTNFHCPSCVRQQATTTSIASDQTTNIKVDGGAIELVSNFCYLGDFITSDGGSERAVQARISMAWNKWRELASLLRNVHIPLRCRSNVYSACIRSVLLYGAVSWSLTQSLTQRICSCDRRMLRYMSGVSLKDNFPSTEVARRCGLRPLEDLLVERRLRWFGHVKRRCEESALGSVLRLNVGGTRPRGRPRKTWFENIKEDMASKGMREEDAFDRDRWRNLIKRPTP